MTPNTTPTNTQLLGAIFDCDGLLADTETPDYDAWREIYEEQGLHLPIELWAQSIGTAKGHSLPDWHAPLAEAIGPDYDPDAVRVSAARRFIKPPSAR